MLVNEPALRPLVDRVAELERRLAALEGKAPVAASGSAGAMALAPRRPSLLEKLDENTWAVIAAVVAVAVPGGRVHAVVPVGAHQGGVWWGLEGRRDIFYSHRVR